jgi:hypothetical protein
MRRVEFGMALPPKPHISEAKRAAIAKARAACPPQKGEDNGRSKLTEAQVRKIRELRAEGERPTVLAARFAVDRTLIWHIVTRRIWTHI